MFKFDNTKYSYYRGIRWLILIRELSYLPSMFYALARARFIFPRIDVIHANEIIEIVPAIVAKLLFRAKLVLHIRSLQRFDVKSKRARMLAFLINKYCDKVIAIDQNVQHTLKGLNNVAVINNSFSWTEDDAKADKEIVAKFESIDKDLMIFGFVGNLHKSKGIDELIEACRILKQRNVSFFLAVVGGETTKTKGILRSVFHHFGILQNLGDDIRSKIQQYALGDVVRLMGPTNDIVSVYKRIDVICFASQLDAPGRPVFEAAFGGVPSILAAKRTFPDTAIPGETCLVVDGADPVSIADAMENFINNPEEVKRMGRNSRELALKNFDPDTNAKKVAAIYRSL